MRIILLLLLLVVFFLTGMLYGVGFEKVEIQDNPVEESAVTLNEPIGEQVEEPREVMPAHIGNTPAFQAASALESIVNFFYSVVVEFLYQVSKLFY